MIFANTLWGKRISVTCDKLSDFKFCSKACGPLAGLLWVFISEESICRLSKHQKRFQSSEHHLFQVSKSTFYFHTYFGYFHIVWGSVLLCSPTLLTLETSPCLVFLMPSVQSLSSYSLRSAWHSYPCQMCDFPFYFLPLFHMLTGAYECFFWHSGFFSLKPSPFVNTAVYQTFVPNSKWRGSVLPDPSPPGSSWGCLLHFFFF